MVQRKPRSEWSVDYRKRIERAEQKAREQGVEFNRQKARGHGPSKTGETEYQRRKRTERQKAGKYWPLTPAQIRQLTKFGPSDPAKLHDALIEARDTPKGLRERFLKDQQYYYDHPEDPRNISIETMKKEFPEVPDILFFYHAWR